MRNLGCIGALSAVLFLLCAFCAINKKSREPTTDPGPKTITTTAGQAMPEADVVIRKVTERYRNLRSYSARALNSYSSTVIETSSVDIPIDIEYRKGGPIQIKWQVGTQTKVFRSDTAKAWLEVDGKRAEEYADLGDGLLAVSMSEVARPLCLVDYFVFHHEILPEEPYFAELIDPKITGEAEVDGVRCYLLTMGFRGVEGQDVYWVAEGDGLIRRIDRTIIVKTNSVSGSRTDTTKTSETYFDIQIETGESEI